MCAAHRRFNLDRVTINADGLSANAFLRVELIDRADFGPCGCERGDRENVRAENERGMGGGANAIRCAQPAYHVRVTFGGSLAAQAKFYVAYLE